MAKSIRRTLFIGVIILIIILPFIIQALGPAVNSGPVGTSEQRNSVEGQLQGGLFLGLFMVWPISVLIVAIIMSAYGIYRQFRNTQIDTKGRTYRIIALTALLAFLLVLAYIALNFI